MNKAWTAHTTILISLSWCFLKRHKEYSCCRKLF